MEFQLLVFLQSIAFSGDGASHRRNARLGRCSVGSVCLFTDRCVVALLVLRQHVVVWPDAAERREIARAFREGWGFPNCIGVVDGTLIPLEQKPSHHGEDYLREK